MNLQFFILEYSKKRNIFNHEKRAHITASIENKYGDLIEYIFREENYDFEFNKVMETKARLIKQFHEYENLMISVNDLGEQFDSNVSYGKDVGFVR